MMSGAGRWLLTLTLTLMMVASVGEAAAPIRRFALVAGANRGAADRVPLRYAVADAERFGDLVTRMGGVQPEDRMVLKDPSRRDFLAALSTMGQQAGAARAGSERVEVVVYFSGHADERGLMLGKETVPYRELRDSVSAMNADVGITILDACASGAITRLKGGKTHPAFLTDPSNAVKGYAFLTSSSETEAAQESDRIRGSFFTGALLTGLRGAADTSGDGRITLNEAYQFAFHETLAQTTTTEAGAQHPAYDIKMAGTGDVVMTDVRKISSRLVLSESYDGRFLVMNQRRALVAELYKPQGRAVELGLEAGKYDVYFEQEKKLSTASVTLADGQRTELLPAALTPTERRPTQRRGIYDIQTGPPDLLDGRTRFELGGPARTSLIHWFRPRLGASVSFGDGDHSAFFLGGRYYLTQSGWFRPHVGLSVGWSQEVRSEQILLAEGSYGTRFDRVTSPDAGFTLGTDFYVGRRLSFQLLLAPETTRGSGFSAGIGWTFGKGRPTR